MLGEEVLPIRKIRSFPVSTVFMLNLRVQPAGSRPFGHYWKLQPAGIGPSDIAGNCNINWAYAMLHYSQDTLTRAVIWRPDRGIAVPAFVPA